MIACSCPVCTSADTRDRRTRASAVFSCDGHNILVDTAPELRLQCIASDITHVDAILLTHAHADHVAGLDDVRRFNDLLGTTLDVYGSAATLARVQRMFSYAFSDDPEYPSVKPELRAVTDRRPFRPARPARHPDSVRPRRYVRAGLPHRRHCLLPGLQFHPGRVARTAGRSGNPGARRGPYRRPHTTHFNLEQAIAEAHLIGARRTYFTHIAHELPHAETSARLPDGMALACDGLVCETD